MCVAFQAFQTPLHPTDYICNPPWATVPFRLPCLSAIVDILTSLRAPSACVCSLSRFQFYMSYTLLQYGEDPVNCRFEDVEGRLAFVV